MGKSFIKNRHFPLDKQYGCSPAPSPTKGEGIFFSPLLTGGDGGEGEENR